MRGENDAAAIAGLLGAVALGVATARWWLAIPAAILLVLCIVACISATPGAYEDREDEIYRTLKSIERSQYSD